MSRGAGAAPAAPAALPALFEFTAPAHWRAVDFVSDLHLAPALPKTLAAFASYLRGTRADAVVILGDLFEVWVGDDARTREFEARCVDLLAEAASRLRLAFMVGNRDFLVGPAMLRDCGLLALPDPTVIDAWGHRVLVSHGDALCLDDEPYQAFRAEVRSASWQARFLAQPLDARLRAAAEMRRASEDRRLYDGDAFADVDAAAAVRWLHALGASELVHGHTHRPGSEALAPGHKRHVLSDWDLDTAQRAEVLRLDRGGFRRLAPADA